MKLSGDFPDPLVLGRQNANKIERRLEIIFNLQDSKVLNDYQKAILKIYLKNKLVNNSLL